MSKTITLSLEDEEHILLVEPNDDIVNLLTSILGPLHQYSFSINGQQVVSLPDLFAQLHDKATIDIKRCTRGIECLSIGAYGSPLEIISIRNPNRPRIKIETVHISCSSDSFSPQTNMVGFIAYTFDNQSKFQLNGRRCQTGYILIKETKNIEHVQSNQGIVHGKLFKWFFEIEPDERFIGAGFSLSDGELKFNSGVFNTRNDDYHDQTKSMNQFEIHLIKYVVKEVYENEKWKQTPTVSTMVIDRTRLVSTADLPIQNHPKWMRNKDIS